MPSLRALCCAAILVAFPASQSMPQSQLKNQSGPPNIPTIQVTSRLVYLDVTVLDKKGNPVVTGLEQRRLHHHRKQEAAAHLLLRGATGARYGSGRRRR